MTPPVATAQHTAGQTAETVSALSDQIEALLSLNADGALSHRVPGLAVTLLTKAVIAIRQQAALVEAAKPFNRTDWLASGVLTDPRSDGLRISLSILGTDYEATVTVGELRALSAAIYLAEGRQS